MTSIGLITVCIIPSDIMMLYSVNYIDNIVVP